MVINNEPIIFNDMPRTSQAVRKLVSRELNQNRFSAKMAQTLAEIEFALSIINQSVEIGRVCIAREYRNSKVLFLLWKSLIDYLQLSQKRCFFGGGSIFTQDCDLGARLYQRFKRCELIRADSNIKPCRKRAFLINEIYESKAEQVELPSLFNLYLQIGAKICGEPAIDREFGTIDFS